MKLQETEEIIKNMETEKKLLKTLKVNKGQHTLTGAPIETLQAARRLQAKGYINVVVGSIMGAEKGKYCRIHLTES